MSDLASVSEALEEESGSGCILSHELRIVKTNEGWRRFALANAGTETLRDWPLGAPVLDAISPVLRPFYDRAFQKALAEDRRWEHDYECSSAERFRRFRMVAWPIGGEFLAILHSLRFERPHDRLEHPADLRVYAVDGVVSMCSHCRRVRNPDEVGRWDWIPGWLRIPPEEISHGLCPGCATYYYG